MKSVKCTPTSEKQGTGIRMIGATWTVKCLSIPSFFKSHEVCDCYFVTLLHRYCSQAKQVHVKLDDRNISPPEGFLLRKGEPIF